MYHPSTNHYMAPTYFAPPPQPGHMHLVAPLPRPTNVPPQRKRPKYTRSKTGCLTCRAKKIKCDETKPNCMRCTHGQRECTWPEGLPTRKKAPPKKQQTPTDTRPSTAESSGVSESSTPPTRNITPPKQESGPLELSLPPLASTRRHSEPYLTLPASGLIPSRRQSIPTLQATTHHGYPAHSLHSHALPVIPEMTSSYPSQRYNSQYSTPLHAHSPGIDTTHISSRPSSSSNSIRRMEHNSHPSAQWLPNHPTPPLMQPVDPIEPYFQTVQERQLVGHPSSNNHPFRYQ
ncbi:hypothetical protein GLOTRDRAFT_115334 [Gloeophyllum trabeum ATCC 11539]|uniref:Zn(2)-C6 fungal-type domain-containing protein n=1 Tax=Gloeophyllum trabeum (strain ATCC 11539 / FP-39264 / Madison 617) TaxID=670483 RepID=S7QBP3_GLOTA|nr:uncharacterized protein GLOTRDRAFT_115334 [Gloeophyllum trabeum ATCC 11539]EPQ57381.1 hypothetical protein GLOTRDRAFT_115334 [Gloeophyllum trabeum ATCC 11539]